MVRAQQKSQEVRDDQSHEADQARHGNRGPDHQRGGQQQDPLVPLHGDAQVLRGFVPQSEQVQATRQAEGDHQPQREKGRHRKADVETRQGQVSDEPEKDPRSIHQSR